MSTTANLISAVAALISSIAWPAVFVGCVLAFRKEITRAIGHVPSLFDRMNKLKLGLLEADLSKVAALAINTGEKDAGEITTTQLATAARIETYLPQIGQTPLIEQMHQLGVEYERVRATMPSGPDRTGAMTAILAKMRVIGPSIADHVEEFKRSDIPGFRLAAVAIMQLSPLKADCDWLIDRFKSDHAFIFYHSAHVLRNLTRSDDPVLVERGRAAATRALEILESFEGVKDANSIRLLMSALAAKPT